jgi:hypothetical protein
MVVRFAVAIAVFATLLPAQQPPTFESLNHELPHWLRFSGDERMRYEGFLAGGFQGGNDDLYLLQRIRFDMRIVPTPWLDFRFETQDARVFFKTLQPYAPPFQDTWDLRLAYVTIGNLDKAPVTLLVGRQALIFGDERILGQTNWSNTARSFDAARVRVRQGKWRLDLFASSVVVLHDGQVGEVTPANNLHGAYGGLENVIPNSVFEPYVLWRLSRGAKTEESKTGNLDTKTGGLRWVGKLPASFDYSIETAMQRGSVGPDHVSTWAGHWVIGRTFSTAALQPRPFIEYNYATGDGDPKNGRQNTFDQLYPTAHDKYGLADQVGWKNIHHLRGGVDLKLPRHWIAGAKYSAYWLADAHDALYNTQSTAIVRKADGSAGPWVGTEFDTTFLWTPAKPVQLGGGLAHIFPGTFLKRAAPGHSYTGPYLLANYTF